MVFSQVFKNAKYISPSDSSCTAPYFLSDLEVADNISKCEISIIGYGLFELYINGVKVSDDIFAPATSDYHKRDNSHIAGLIYYNEETKRSYYLKYDLMPYLKKGKNRVAVLVGKGWYCIDCNHDEKCQPYGDEKLCFEITMKKKGGKEFIASYTDKNMKWTPSHILENDLFYGEKQDLNVFDTSLLLPESDISNLESSVEAFVPETNYSLQDFPSDKVIRTIKPKLIKNFGDYAVYDNGENITGYVRVKCDKKGEYVKLIHAEEIDENCEIYGDNIHLWKKKQCDEYTTDGSGRILVPHFTYHGFRYFSCTTNAEPVETVVVHTDLKVDSHFHCDNETLNWMYDAAVRTFLDNVHGCIPFDCPTREKLGYTGDGQLICELGTHLVESKEFYLKWLDDIADSQDMYTGHVPHTAPYQGGGGGLGWGTAIVEVPYQLWKYYGDKSVIEKYFHNMTRWMAYMDSRSECGFATNEETGWCLGDWGFPYEEENYQLLCPNYVNTYFYVKNYIRMEEIATALGHPKYAKMCREKAEFSKKAMKAAYMSPMNNCFYNDFSGGNSFAIDIGVGTQKTLDETVRKYTEYGGFDCGIFAADALIRVLFENGKADLAFKLLTSHKEKASYGYMKDCGATTFWEYMTGMASHNHPMFSAPVSSFFKYLLGIRQTKDSYGYTDVVISPCLVDELQNLEGYITVPKGKIEVKISGKKITVTIPKGVKAAFDACGVKKRLSAGENVIEL